MHNRELAQKPREPHAAFGHCVKPRAEMKFDLTEKPSQWKGSWVQGQVLVGEELICASTAGRKTRKVWEV
jgi:hypothetical protein